MKDETKKQPQTDAFKAMAPVPEKSIIVKNIIFGIFIILSIIFCFQKYFERAQRAEFEEGMRLFNSAMEKLNDDATKNEALIIFDQAETFFEDTLVNNKNVELVLKSTEMMAQCYAMMATCPNVLNDKTIEYYKKALAADFNCPLVSDAVRLKYGDPEMIEMMTQRTPETTDAIPGIPAQEDAPTAEPPQTPELQPLPANPIPADALPNTEAK